jgi:hypothetical protein
VKKEKMEVLIIVSSVFFGLNIFCRLTPFAKGYSHYMHYFDTNTDTYFIDGDIEINATYDMWYDPLNEYMYFQVQIFNSTNDLIWKTSRYETPGNYDEVWIVNISDLSLLNQYSNELSVRFFVHHYYNFTTETSDTFLREKQIQIIKKETSCQLIGYINHLQMGENFSFKARFYDSVLGDSEELINQTVLFRIENNGKKIFDCNYTINSLGLIEINIWSSTHLKIGQNSLFFEIKNNKIYNDSFFYYEVLVEEILLSNEKPWQLSFFSIASIVVIASIIFIIISNINKNLKQRSLSEITFRF